MRLLALLFFLVSVPAFAGTVPAEITTPAGIKVWYLRDATTPSMSISFAFRGGVEEDSPATQGATALMAGLLDEGAGNLSATAFQQQLADNNITFTVSAVREAVRGKIRFLLAHTDRATALSAMALQQPTFSADDVARVRQGALAELSAAASDPSWQAQRLAMQQVFAGTPYAQAASGTPDTLAVLTPAAIKTAHQRHIVRNRLVVAVVSAADADETAKIIDAIFAGLPAGTPWQATPVTLQNTGTTWYHPWAGGGQGSEQTHIIFTAPGIAPTDPDYPAAMVLNDIYGGGGFRALLMDELRQTLGATYGASTGMMALTAAPLVMGRTSVAAPATGKAMDIIRDIRTGLMGRLTAKNIADSIAFLSGSITRDLTSAPAIADYYLGLQLQGLPADYADRLPTQLQTVDENTLHRVFERLYSQPALAFAVVGPVPPATITRTITNLWTVE